MSKKLLIEISKWTIIGLLPGGSLILVYELIKRRKNNGTK